jgi:hypothetical protein
MTVPLRAALYLRVSTARQAEHDVSIPDQRRRDCFETRTTRRSSNAQRAILGRFGGPDQRVRFSPNRIVLETASGEPTESRENPRGAFKGHQNDTPWDRFHAAYFDGYALWTYLTQPFLYSYPGFETVEIEPWEEGGETWRRLEVIFPGDIASHTREHTSSFGSDGLLRRHDYAVDVLGGATGDQYIEDYHEHGGILMPHRASRLSARPRQSKNLRTPPSLDRYPRS